MPAKSPLVRKRRKNRVNKKVDKLLKMFPELTSVRQALIRLAETNEDYSLRQLYRIYTDNPEELIDPNQLKFDL